MNVARSFYDASYAAEGFNAQRRYPNEELCRFMGRRFFPIAPEYRKEERILEVGCGSGANLWMIADEGFDAYGVDISTEAVALCDKMLAKREVSATLKAGDMTKLDFPDIHFSAVVDVFSSYCLNEAQFQTFLAEVRRVLQPGAPFFTYTPSQGSDAFKDHAPSGMLDAATLDGIRRPTSPFADNLYPFRFEDRDTLVQKLDDAGFNVAYVETVGRTYRSTEEYFEFVTIEARRD